MNTDEIAPNSVAAQKCKMCSQDAQLSPLGTWMCADCRRTSLEYLCAQCQQHVMYWRTRPRDHDDLCPGCRLRPKLQEWKARLSRADCEQTLALMHSMNRGWAVKHLREVLDISINEAVDLTFELEQEAAQKAGE